MPTRPARSCPTPGCCNYADGKGSYCVVCKRNKERIRGSASQRGYGTAHRAWREMVLQQDSGLCQACLSQGIVQAGRVADHIIPIKAGGSPDDLNNGQCLCDGETGRGCHDRKREAEKRGKQLQVMQGQGLVDVGALGHAIATRWVEHAEVAA